MRKKVIFLLAIAISCTYALLSCHRQVDELSSSHTTLIEKAHAWFNQFEAGANLQDQFKQVTYLWNKAEAVTFANKNQAIAVPIVEKNIKPGYRGIRFLYVYPWKNGKGFYTEVQEILPDLDYTVYNKKVSTKTFSGYVARWDLEKGFSYAIKYKQGVAVAGANFTIVPADAVKKDTKANSSDRLLDPVTVIAYIHKSDNSYYQANIVPIEADFEYHYNPCEYTNCNPIDMDQYYTDEMLLNMLNAYLSYLNTNLENHNIKDSADDPCITSVLGTLESIGNSLPAIVNSTFGSSATFSLTILSKDLSSDFDAKAGQIGSTYADFKIAMNTDYNTRTDLSTAAVIMHEAMHAQMYSWYLEANMNNNTALMDSLKTNYGFLMKELNLTDNSEHAAMASNYIDCLATAIQQFAAARGIDVDAQYCRDLAWGGLEGTKPYSLLSDTDKARIDSRISAERDPKGTSTNTSHQAAKGKGCN